MKIVLLILFIGACNASWDEIWKKFDEDIKNAQQQVAAANQQVAAANQQVAAANQLAATLQQQHGHQNQGTVINDNVIHVNRNGRTDNVYNYEGNQLVHSIQDRQVNGVIYRTEQKLNRSTGQLETFRYQKSAYDPSAQFVQY